MSSIVKKHAMMGHVIEILVIAQNVISLLINKLNFADQHLALLVSKDYFVTNRVLAAAKIPANATTLPVTVASLVTMATIATSRAATVLRNHVASKQEIVTMDVLMSGMGCNV